MKDRIKVAFIGNPNCGKTTLFNAYTGAKLKVANWPGVTVERKEGMTSYKNDKITLIDLPGIYSLTSYSIEERVSRKSLVEEDIDVIVNIVDASSLERNLYLTMQLLELGKPIILALNMMDVVIERGMKIDLHRLQEMLGGIPVVPVSARKKTGLDVLLQAIVHHNSEGPNNFEIPYSNEIEDKIKEVINRLSKKKVDCYNLRWHAIKLLEKDEEIGRDYKQYVDDIVTTGYEKNIINQKYDYIEEIIEETLVRKNEKSLFTDKIDNILIHPFFGIPIFLMIMASVFFFTFEIGDLLKGGFEFLLNLFSSEVYTLLLNINTSKWLNSLIIDGIIAGVGGILTFLPNIFILFLALALLEDSGYMARVAYIMDGLMSKAGLSGKAFLPMVLAFGCSVPAVMATRTLEKESDRKKTILILPFMSCSARLPIYILFASMFFGEHAMFVSYSLYMIGLVIAIIIVLILGKLSKQGNENTLLIELPEYKTPNARTIIIYVWDKVKDYLTKAGTTIFIASILLWFILNFNINGMTNDVSSSFGAEIGKRLVPVLKPAGLGIWQIAVALISGLSAKEVVVSSFSVLFGVTNINSQEGMSQLSSILSESGFHAMNAYSLMIFCLLYTPCMATIATIKKESKSLWFTITVMFFQLGLAWLVSTLVFQIGRLFF